MQRIVVILFIFLVSCKSQRRAASSGSIILGDSITYVAISFRPSFIDRSALYIDRSDGTVRFTTRDIYKVKYGSPKTIDVSLDDMALSTGIDSFWNSAFIESLSWDTTQGPALDGMDVTVDYENYGRYHSINLGNIRTPRVDSILVDKINYLQQKTADTSMQIYLKLLRRYLRP